ncbi:MAG: hypothetical protein VB120_03280 [Lachnospiraceae bacterium]|nr:hypothetical protein [Lachnospiraceae bacterium]
MNVTDKKELNIFEIISIAMGVFKGSVLNITLTVITIYFPIAVLSEMIAQRINFETLFTDFQAVIEGSGSFANIISSTQLTYFGLLMLVQIIIAPLLTMAIAVITKGYLSGEKIDYKKASITSISHGPGLIITSLLSSAVTMLGYMLFFVPGLYFTVIFHFFAYSIVLNDKGIFESLTYSKSLTKGRWFKVFLYMAIFYIVVLGFNNSISALFIILGGSFSAGIFTSMLEAFIESFFYVITTVWFLNLENFKNEPQNS